MIKLSFFVFLTVFSITASIFAQVGTTSSTCHCGYCQGIIDGGSGQHAGQNFDDLIDPPCRVWYSFTFRVCDGVIEICNYEYKGVDKPCDSVLVGRFIDTNNPAKIRWKMSMAQLAKLEAAYLCDSINYNTLPVHFPDDPPNITYGVAQSRDPLSSAIFVFPNPAKQETTISIPNFQPDMQLKIIDAQYNVRDIPCNFGNCNNISIPLSTYPHGIYLVILYQNGSVIGRNFLIVRE